MVDVVVLHYLRLASECVCEGGSLYVYSEEIISNVFLKFETIHKVDESE